MRFRLLVYLLFGVMTVMTATTILCIGSRNVQATLEFGKIEHMRAMQKTSQGDGKTLGVKPLSYSQFICNITISREMDLMKMKRLPFIKKLKNPCWYEGKTLRCLPYMFLVGVAKCGTTDLFKRITLHPDFMAPTVKEPLWLSSSRFWKNESFSYYTSTFFSPISEALSKSASTDLITGEASINTLEGAHFWPYLGMNKGLDEPIENNPEYIFHLNNETRILINVRNPVDRLWSEYLAFSKRNNKSAERFHKIVKHGLHVYKDCLQTRSLRGCMYDRPMAMFSTMSRLERQTHKCYLIPRDIVMLRRGVYHVFIKDYLEVFPWKHVLIQKLEEISDYPERALTRTFEFLGLKMPSKAQMQKILDLDIKNSRRTSNREKGEMLESTRLMLYEFYKPHNKQLAKLLNDSRYNYGPRG